MPAISARKLEANRRNAQKSTGPRTAAGKARVARNALKHGLTARTIVLDPERAEDFLALRDRWRAEYGSNDPVVRDLIDRIAVTLWKLGRLAELEAAAFVRQQRQLAPRTRPSVEALLNLDAAQLSDRRLIGEPLMRRLRAAQVQPASEPFKPEPFEQYGRYEGSLQATLYRAFGQLRRLQRREAAAAKNLQRDQSQTIAGAAQSRGYLTNRATAAGGGEVRRD